MSRYQECLRRVRQHVRDLINGGTNPAAIEGLVESFVEQPAYVDFRDRLIHDALMMEEYQRPVAKEGG